MPRSFLITLVALVPVALWIGCAPSSVLRSPDGAVTQVRLAPPLSPNAFVLEPSDRRGQPSGRRSRGERGPIVVDPGPPGDAHAKRLDAALEAAGYRPSDVALVILTHGHADHAGGAARLQALGATVVAGAGDLEALRAGQSDTLHAIGLEAEMVEAMLVGSGTFPAVEPDFVLDADRPSLDLEAWGVAGRVVQMPGHTPGSLAVLLDSGDIIAGDLVRGGYLGGLVAASKPVTHYFQEDQARARGNVRALLEWGARRLYVGHGGPLEADRLAAWANR